MGKESSKKKKDSNNYEYCVHAYLRNYLRYGTTRREKQDTKGQLDFYINRHKEIIENKKQNAKDNKGETKYKEIENFYKGMLFGIGALAEGTSDKLKSLIAENRGKYQQKITEILKEKFNKEVVFQENNLLNGTFKEENNSTEQVKVSIYQRMQNCTKKIQEAKEHYISTLEDRVNDLIKTLGEIMKQNGWANDIIEGETAVNDLKNELDGIQKEIEKLKNQVETDDKEIGISKNIKISKDDNLVTRINNIIEQISAKSCTGGSKANLSGVLGELAATIVTNEIMNGINIGFEYLEDFITQEKKDNIITFVGDKKIKIDYENNKSFEVKTDNGIFQMEKTASNYGNTHTSKIDVFFNLPLLNGEIDPPQRIGASVKNYKSIRGQLTIVDGTPIHTLFTSLENDTILEGHFANLIVNRTEEQNKQEEGVSIFDTSKYANDIHALLKQQALINAFEGYDKENIPDLFIAFGYKDKNVKVYDMQYLIGKVLSNTLEKVEFYKTEKKEKINKATNERELKDVDVKINLLDKKDFNIKGNTGRELTSMAQQLFLQHKIHVSTKILTK